MLIAAKSHFLIRVLVLSICDIEQVMVEFHHEKAFGRTGIRIVGHEEAVLKTIALAADNSFP